MSVLVPKAFCNHAHLLGNVIRFDIPRADGLAVCASVILSFIQALEISRTLQNTAQVLEVTFHNMHSLFTEIQRLDSNYIIHWKN